MPPIIPTALPEGAIFGVQVGKGVTVMGGLLQRCLSMAVKVKPRPLAAWISL